MKQLKKKEIYEKIRSILKIKVFDIQNIKLKIYNMRTFLWMSSIYTLVWIIFAYNPHELRDCFKTHISLYHVKELMIATIEFMFLVYLPEIVIYIYDFIVKRCKLENKIVIKNIRILIMILSYVYLVLFGILILVILIAWPNIFAE